MLSKHIFAAFLSLALSSYAVEAVPGNHGGFNQFKPGQLSGQSKPVKSASTTAANNVATCAAPTTVTQTVVVTATAPIATASIKPGVGGNKPAVTRTRSSAAAATTTTRANNGGNGGNNGNTGNGIKTTSSRAAATTSRAAATTSRAAATTSRAAATTSRAAATTSRAAATTSRAANGNGNNNASKTTSRAAATTTSRAGASVTATPGNGNTGGNNNGGNTGNNGGNTGNNGGNTGNNGGNTGNNGGNTGNNGGNAQTSFTLDPKVIAKGFANDGQDVPADGQVRSLTSTNNFINFCLTVPNLPITDGKQIQSGSCNPTPIGAIPSIDNMPSSKFVNPPNFSTIKANTPFKVVMNIKNMEAGHFTNAQANYFAAPQQLNGRGQIQGHSHVVMEKLTSLAQVTPTDPKKFAFFKGLNSAAQNGQLTADVTEGLPVGFYRLASINAASNHQPVIAPVAQHGSLDDVVYFTVTTSGQPLPGTNGGKGNNLVDPNADLPASSSASSSATATASGTASVSGTVSSTGTAASSTASRAASVTPSGTSSASASSTTAASTKAGKPGKTASTSAAASSAASSTTPKSTATAKASSAAASSPATAKGSSATAKATSSSTPAAQASKAPRSAKFSRRYQRSRLM